MPVQGIDLSRKIIWSSKELWKMELEGINGEEETLRIVTTERRQWLKNVKAVF